MHPNGASDEDLMQWVRRGNEAAFAELYRRYADRVWSYGYRMLDQEPARAEDFRQQVFLQVLEAADRFDARQNFATWLFSIAANLLKNQYRTRERRHRHLKRLPVTDRAEVDYSRLLDADYETETLRRAIAELPVPQQLCLQLRFRENRSIAEIASLLGCPAGTVKSRLHYALRTLSQRLAHLRIR